MELTKVQSYNEWKEVVLKEYRYLSKEADYLNKEGHKKLEVYNYLCSMSIFADSAIELLNIFNSDTDTEQLLESQHALGPLSRLRIIAREKTK